MAVILGLSAAVTYGAADFLGGLATRKSDVLTVVLVSQLLGSVALGAALLPFLDAPFTTSALAWGAAAGVGGSSGVILLYRGLALGRMSVVAPITAVQAALVPVAFGLVTGERPALVALAGVALALPAIALVSSAPGGSGGSGRAGVPEALAAGVAFAVFFIFLERAGDASGLWPLVGSRLSSLALVCLAALARRSSLRPEPGEMRTLVAIGVLNVAANVLFLLSTREGLLSLVAVLTSLYPATTVVLARVVLRERLGRLQLVGLAAAGAGVALIALG